MGSAGRPNINITNLNQAKTNRFPDSRSNNYNNLLLINPQNLAPYQYYGNQRLISMIII